ncbi:MAG: DUF3486 family protein [Betaproteobacteria bacterium]|nr:MAG: DUF3486 family protein [Betaproteobacteria bacterium]
MGRKPKMDRLPKDVKTYIEGLMADGRFTLDEMIADLRQRFPEQQALGVLPSRAALHRYGPKLERRLMAVKAFTDAAQAIDAHAQDKGDTRSAALTAIVQQELFDAMIALGDATDPDVDAADRIGMLSAAAKNIATLARSSVHTKQFQAKVEAQTRAKVLAEQRAKLEDLGKTGAIAPDVLARVIKAAYDL